MEPLSSPGAARAYQLEMLDHSLKQNVIVAMDTGSGKTRINSSDESTTRNIERKVDLVSSPDSSTLCPAV
ncbi:hypothetical protein ISF_10042 [Cordyceps fumosorosea ARSEF 2679]|uniref:Uncharacterized protein n=1 Tax=Cordyceps fumosorosea (strain ARSEF 2679) TaxID=1081104 RepID=A0A166VSB2_CORFA|nr:hypothetical protein ISF_10042 [Cordyceps fumosorosea ARSEF 2679]OAA33980.1 hypothetical protein ISF_10042 [Cordyceps fumosorosea ARSEF 2679]